MQRPIFRPDPILPVGAMQTYAIIKQPGTHTRAASCGEIGCAAFSTGWKTRVDVSTPLGAGQANYIRLHSGRHFTVVEDGNLVTFSFPAGQKCFAEHQVSLEREPFYVKHGGDWRGRTSGPLKMRSIDWVDDFANHQSDLADRKEKG